MTGSWVLTSPAVYLAHRPIIGRGFNRQNGGGVGPFNLTLTSYTVRPSGLFSLQSQDIFSKRPVLFRSKDNVEEARLIAKGLWRPERGQLYAGQDLLYETNSFDFGHLKNPVPASVYFDAREDCWGEQTHCATITDDSYRPRLLLKRSIWRSLLGNHYFCELPLLVDPPVTLRPIEGGEGTMVAPFPAIVAATPTVEPDIGILGQVSPHGPDSPRPGSFPFGKSRLLPTNGPVFGPGNALTNPKVQSYHTVDRGHEIDQNARINGVINPHGNPNVIQPGSPKAPSRGGPTAASVGRIGFRNGQSERFQWHGNYKIMVFLVCLFTYTL